MSGYRGRLINPMLVRLAPLDTRGTTADPDAAGPRTSGYDPLFRETVKLPVPGKSAGVSARKELPEVELLAQLEGDEWGKLELLRTGNSPRFKLVLVLHFRDLERQQHIDSVTGEAMVPRVGDRLVSIHHRQTKQLVQQVPNPPGLFCTEAHPASFGLSGGQRNLLLCTFEDRASSIRPGGG